MTPPSNPCKTEEGHLYSKEYKKNHYADSNNNGCVDDDSSMLTHAWGKEGGRYASIALRQAASLGPSLSSSSLSLAS